MHDLIQQAKAGDSLAWNELYNQHYPWMYAQALLVCGNTPSARDVVQETFIQVYLKLAQLKDPDALPAWLKTTLLRYCYRHCRPHNSKFAYYSVFLENNKCWEDEINQKIDLCAVESKLYEVLSFLPETLRAVVMLRYFSDRSSYEEMALILSVPVGTIRSRLNQAKFKLTQCWAKANVESELALREATQWNHFYQHSFGNIHFSTSSRKRFIQHVDKNVEFVVTSGKTIYGRHLIEKEINDDLLCGSYFHEMRVTSNGSISVIEVTNVNSVEYPDRCPDSSILVLYRTKGQVTKVNLHNS